MCCEGFVRRVATPDETDDPPFLAWLPYTCAKRVGVGVDEYLLPEVVAQYRVGHDEAQADLPTATVTKPEAQRALPSAAGVKRPSLPRPTESIFDQL